MINASGMVESQASLSKVSCNHVVVRINPEGADVYVNGEWIKIPSGRFYGFSAVEMGPYNGRIWDIQVFDGSIVDDEIYKMSQYCLTAYPVDSVPNSDFPNALCAAYICLWGKDSLDLNADNIQYYLVSQEKSFETFTFKAGIYPHGDLENYINGRRGRDLVLYDGIVNKFAKNTFSNPFTRNNVNYWWHENFHSFQGFHPQYHIGKWGAEATAEWAPDMVFPGAKSTLLGWYTLNPHLPLWTRENSPVDDFDGWEFKGGHMYGAYVFFSYLTNFVSTDFFMGKFYNEGRVGSDPVRAIDDLLAEEGHDLRTVFGDFAARTTVWDYENGTGPYFAESEAASLKRMKNAKPDAETFDNKFTNILKASGTEGNMTAIPAKLVPGSWAYNTYKVDSTSAAPYTFKLKGDTTNPEVTKFQARVVLESNGEFTYFNFPIGDDVAFGETEARIQVDAQAGDQLYLVVATTPDVYSGYDYNYRYEYSIQADTADSLELKKSESSLAGLDADYLTVYPTITSGNLNIDLKNHQSGLVDVTILKTTGEVVVKKTYHNTSFINLDFEGPSGMYLLKVRSNDQNKVVKIIKQ